jgi:hypothetical protein
MEGDGEIINKQLYVLSVQRVVEFNSISAVPYYFRMVLPEHNANTAILRLPNELVR